MLLPSKSDIQKKKANERQVEIHEGMKLAKRVDGLRETSAKEETRLQKFREESLKQVLADIEEKTGIKGNLLAEIEMLKQRRIELMRPLDHEWKLLRDKESELLEFEKSVEQKESEWNIRNQDTTRAIQKLEVDRAAVEQMKNDYDANALRLRGAETSINQKIATTEQRIKEFDLYVESLTKDLLTREANVAVRERDVLIKQEQVAKDRKDLNEREKFINDKYNTLLKVEEIQNG